MFSVFLSIHLAVGQMVTLFLNLWGTAKIFSKVSAITLHSHQQQRVRVLISPHFLCFWLFDDGHPHGCEVVSHWFWWLMMWVAHVTCLLGICIFSLEKCLLKLSPVFNWVICPINGWFLTILYIFWVQIPWSTIWFACIFSHSVGCLVTFLVAFFETYKFQILMKSTSLCFCHLCVWCHEDERLVFF